MAPAPNNRENTGAEDVRQKVHELMPILQSNLERLVRLPSIALNGFSTEPLMETAVSVGTLLRTAGLPDVRLLDIPGASPAVYGCRTAQPGAPTVLLYAHYDVQPSGDTALWNSPPFEPVVRGGRLYGRGAADDKSGIIMHIGALRALGENLATGIIVLVEGKEECSDGELETFVDENPELFVADAVVIADAQNAEVGMPTLTTSLRGLFFVTLEVATLEGPVHSGSFGGAAPDALIALVRMLSTLWDVRGNVAVPGLDRLDYEGVPYDEARFRSDAGVLEGVDLLGSGDVATRIFRHPSITIIGMDVPAVEGASNSVVPRARARLSARVAPGQDSAKAASALVAYLESSRPWNVRLIIETAVAGQGFAARTDGPAYAAAKIAMEAAYGTPALESGEGAAIPLVTSLAAIAPHAEVILWGAAEPSSHIHGIDESVALAELERATLAEALFLQSLAAQKM